MDVAMIDSKYCGDHIMINSIDDQIHKEQLFITVFI